MTSALPALLAGAGVFLLVTGRTGAALAERVGWYVIRPGEPAPAAPEVPDSVPLRMRHAGLAWTARTVRARRGAAVAAGALVGLLAGQGDLVVATTGGTPVVLGVLGAASGMLAFSIWLTRRRERRTALLREELPVVADSLALHVVAGESVATSLEVLTSEGTGVAVDELAHVLGRYRAGWSLPEALVAASRDTLHADASRLYTLLGNAHETGGRLADALAELAADYRAALARDLTSEGGRRALAMYGPILALMIPVALLFLMYPTLSSLTDLSRP